MEPSREAAVADTRQPTERRSQRQARPTAAPQAAEAKTDPTDLKNPALYINRELSWLEFNERVLAQARDASHPLLERVKFLAITGTNLDEFFMIRVATTLKKLREEIEDVAPDGFNTEQQLEAMRARGLARGGSLHNAVVLDDTGIISGPLRFRDEFVRHKVMDLIGDLALLGRPLHGHIHARKAGHALHIEFARALDAAINSPVVDLLEVDEDEQRASGTS